MMTRLALDPEVYRDAALDVFEFHRFSCSAARTCAYFIDPTYALEYERVYSLMFSPIEGEQVRIIDFDLNHLGGRRWSSRRPEEAWDHRVFCLLLAAEMAESGDLWLDTETKGESEA